MKKVQGLAASKMLFAALSISLIVVGIAQAQVDIPVFTGTFTLTDQVQWGKTVLQPGNYTITVGSDSVATLVLVRDSKGQPVARLMSGIDDGKTSVRNALLIREKGGQLHVYGLALASLGRVLVYDPVLAREAMLDARVPQTVPVMLAKK
ncbi:MAG TPA: hypothetical protein VEG68_03535 [Terriglobales bacterium]|nr:hypothetical protein [Terriglobales bacterium]